MTLPYEMSLDLPIKIPNGVTSTTTRVWDILSASYKGDIYTVKRLVADCPELIFAQYNYTPPIHFAVREGHLALVNYLLEQGAHDPTYRIDPFLDSLLTMAQDRNYHDIVSALQRYEEDTSKHKYAGDNGRIIFPFTPLQQEFEKAVEKAKTDIVEGLLKDHPDLVNEKNYFWGEGILMRPAKEGNIELMKLLLKHGAVFPERSKWPQFYYFERYDSSIFILDHGMSVNHKTWQEVTILHDMAQKGNLETARLLIEHGAMLDPVDDDYQSTPLGMAARWGHIEMVKYLLESGADINKAGAKSATPLKWAQKKGHKEIEKLLLDAGALM